MFFLWKVTKSHRQKTLTEGLYYVFWSILSQMRHACCEIFPKQFVPKFEYSMVKFSMPAILDIRLASQTMYFGVSYFVRYFEKTPKICCYGLIASYFIPLKMFGIIWINKSKKKNDLKLQLSVKILSRRLLKCSSSPMEKSNTLKAITLQRNIQFRWFKKQNGSFNKPYQMHLV